MNRIDFKLAGIVAVLSLAFAWFAFWPHTAPRNVFTGSTMGTNYTVRVRRCTEDQCALLEAAIARRLVELETRFSHYDPQAELTAFNNHASTDWYAMDAEMLMVISLAQSISWQTDGAFDVTAGALIDAWGFGPTSHESDPGSAAGWEPPPAATLSKLRQYTGYTRLRIRENPPALAKAVPQLRVDLSAIAKGYAVDQLALLLESNDIKDYLVEIGGEIRTSGLRAPGAPWRIGIEPPEADLNIDYIVTPRSEAVATSGDYRHFHEFEGQRYSHTIDPRTAAPVTHNLASVSVIRPSATEADALATALMVLGPEDGTRYALDNDIPALFWLRTEQGLTAVSTPRFDEYLLRD